MHKNGQFVALRFACNRGQTTIKNERNGKKTVNKSFNPDPSVSSKGLPLQCFIRVMGNYHARFLGGRGPQGSCPTRCPEQCTTNISNF